MPAEFTPDGVTKASDPLLLYFTSGTTAQPKLVEHTQVSYPVGHLSTMYWIGLRPGDTHLNISSPGWAKHAWSNVFAPWIAEATTLILGYERFSADLLLRALGEQRVSTFCAPPTVWRMLIQSDLAAADVSTLRECVAAGEPLNPEVIEQVRRAWHITVRDGYGQTETTAQVGNTPGQPLKLGSMGRALPGYTVALVDPITGETAEEGELCLDLSRRPLGLMTGYRGDPERAEAAMRGGFYHTGDVASRDDDGYLTYVGPHRRRVQGVGLPDLPVRAGKRADRARGGRGGRSGTVPGPGAAGGAQGVRDAGGRCRALPETALAIFAYTRERLAPYKRVRRLEFADLPKTISGKIRRVELRAQETDRATAATRARRARAASPSSGKRTSRAQELSAAG